MRTITTKLFAVILPILAFGAMTSCTNDLDYDYGISEAELSEQPQSPYHIPLPEALGNLEAMMSEMGMDKTRALQRGKWTVQRIPLSAFKPQTRSGGEAETSDAIYVVNFDNDEGFAILSADDRLPDDVIAVSSRGNIIDFNPNPEDGYEDTLTIDDLYVPEDDDYLLGATSSDRVIEGLVTNYIIDWTDNPGDTTIHFEPVPRLTYTHYYETITKVPEMLSTTWHQDMPFNDFCDRRYNYINWLGCEDSEVHPYDFDAVGEWGDDYIGVDTLAAGCVAIAVAQILAYNEHPALSDLIGDGGTEDWDWLLANHYTIAAPEDRAEAIARQNELYAKLVHNVGVGCDMKYGFLGKTQSFATPLAAAGYLEDIGHSEAKAMEYDFSKVRSMLDNNYPVFVGAVRLQGDIGGHAWVVDGYQSLQRTTVATNTAGQVVSTTTTIVGYYVHCNWGWSGMSDGWFANNLLEDKYIATNNAESFDDTTVSPANYHYDFWFRMIEYNK